METNISRSESNSSGYLIVPVSTRSSSNHFHLYIFWSLSVFGAIVNTVFIAVVLACRSFRRPANYPLLLISVASILIVGTTTFWANGYNGLSSQLYALPSVCGIFGTLRKVPQPIISYTTISIISDRKAAGRNPLARPKPWAALKRLLGIICLSSLVSVPHGFQFVLQDSDRPAGGKCRKILLFGSEGQTLTYQLLFLLIGHLYPAAVIAREIWISRSYVRSLLSSADRPTALRDKKCQLAVTSVVFSLFFLLCWPQLGTFQFLTNLPPGALSRRTRSTIEKYWKYARILSYSYSCANPTLLVILCYDWRRTTILTIVAEPGQRARRRQSRASDGQISYSGRSRDSVALVVPRSCYM